MKKLIAMIGAVATAFGLYATAPATIENSFETVLDGVSDGAFTAAAPWAYSAEETIPVAEYADGEVTPYAESGAMARRDDEFTNSKGVNNGYLKLETGKETLDLTVGGNTFVDQLVKFTGFEEYQTNFVEGTKIAVWMTAIEQEGTPAVPGNNEPEEIDNGEGQMIPNPDYVAPVAASADYVAAETNLYVSVGKVESGEVTTIKLKIDQDIKGNALPAWSTEKWYRLTIKTIGNIFSTDKDDPRAGFVIFIDGVQVASSDSEAQNLIDTTMAGTPSSLMSKGALFTSISANDTFTKVGYQGIGAIDDVIADTKGPAFAQTVDVEVDTLGIAGAKVIKVEQAGEEVLPDGTTYTLVPGDIIVWYAPDGAFVIKGDGHATWKYNDGKWEQDPDASDIAVVDAVAKIGDEYFDELGGALAKIQVLEQTEEEIEVEILGECDYEADDESFSIGFSDEATVTIVKGGTWIVDGDVVFVGDIGSEGLAKNVAVDGELTFSGTVKAGSTLNATTMGTEEVEIAIEAGAKIETKTDISSVLDDIEKYDATADKPEAGWTTWTVKGVEPETTGFAIIIAGETETTTNYYDSLDEAIAAAGTDGLPAVVTIMENVNVAATATIEKEVAIDLNGNTMTFGEVLHAFSVLNGGDLTVANGTVVAPTTSSSFYVDYGGILELGDEVDGTTLTVNVTKGIAMYDGTTVGVNADVTINASNGFGVWFWDDGETYGKPVLEFAGKVVANGNAAIMGSGNDTRGCTVTIADGAWVECADGTNEGIYMPGAGTLAIGAATVKGYTGVYVKAGATTVIDGATIIGTGAKKPYEAYGNGSKPTGDAFVVDNCGYPAGADLNVAISGGTFDAQGGAAAVASYADTAKGFEPLAGFITGGKFKGDTALATALIAEGYELGTTPDADGFYSVEQSVGGNFQIVDGNSYATLAEAVAAAEAGDTIKLLADETNADAVTIDKAITLDLGGKTLTSTATLTTSADVAVTNGMFVYNATSGYAVNIKGGTFTVADEATITYGENKTGANEFVVLNAGKIDVYGTIDANYAACFAIAVRPTDATAAAGIEINCYEGCVVSSYANAIKYNGQDCGGKINIYGGTISSNGAGTYVPFYLNKTGNTTVVKIMGGTFLAGTGTDVGDGIVKTEDKTTTMANFVKLDDTCTAKFNSKKGSGTVIPLAELCADGYEPVLGEDGYYTIQKYVPPVAKIGTTEFKTLQAAFDAAQAGETVELLDNLTVDTMATMENKDLIFNLGGYTLLNDGAAKVVSITNSTVVITNGTINGVAGYAVENTGTSHITIARDATIVSSSAYIVFPRGAVVDVYGTINQLNNQYAPCIWASVEGCVINIYDGANLSTPGGDIIRHRCNMPEPSDNAAVVNIYGGTFSGGDVIYGYASSGSVNNGKVNIYGGTFTVNKVYNILASADLTVRPFDGECSTLKFSKLATGLAEACAEGYMPALVDGWYVIKAARTVTLKNGDAVVDTQVVADGQFATNVVLDVEGFKGWTNDTYTAAFDFATTAITADTTLFAWIESAGPVYPPTWPDAEVYTEAFGVWAGKYDLTGVDLTTDAAKNAFLWNADPAATLPTLKIESIAVADGVATIVVSAEGKDLQTGINGVLYVSGCNALGGEWVTTVVDATADFTDGKATFTVEGAQFMKAKIGFKAETPAVK